METVFCVLEVIVPITLAIGLGILAKRKQLMTDKEVRGLQEFAIQFGLPCVVFSSCLTADMGLESLSSMVLILIPCLLGTFWAFGAGKKKFPYHNLPMLFCARETGMLGIPLFIILFGAGEAYRVGILDLTQAVTAYPVIAILTANAGENPSGKQIVKKVFSSPLLICSFAGLALNLSGIGAWMDQVGIGSVVKASTSFLSQPISALMIFSVGYNFTLDKDCRKDIFRIAGVHFGGYVAACILAQLALTLIPGVDVLTRWAVLLYCVLPCSYLSPGMGRTHKEQAVASGVCSVLTVVCLAVFCVLTVFVV